MSRKGAPRSPQLTRTNSELIVQGFFMSVTIWIVQLFYAWRLWMISNKALLVPLLIATLSCAQVGAAIWIGVFLANNRSYAGLGGMEYVERPAPRPCEADRRLFAALSDGRGSSLPRPDLSTLRIRKAGADLTIPGLRTS